MKNCKNSLWSTRMRASKKNEGQGARGKGQKEMHISGAEGLYALSEINKAVKEYTTRALAHPRGMPDRVVITIEQLSSEPEKISLLPVSTVNNASAENAKKIIRKLLFGSGLTKKAIQKSLRIINGKTVMRGAALINASSGARLEPDKQRGVRVSRLGITKSAEKRLSKTLADEGINTSTVKEALILASKVASCKGVVAELCMSDDPDYTTGYIASKAVGYVRIPKIKQKGSLSGGRVFFIKEGADVKRIIDYLENIPVIAVTRF